MVNFAVQAGNVGIVDFVGAILVSAKMRGFSSLKEYVTGLDGRHSDSRTKVGGVSVRNLQLRRSGRNLR